ncbi:tyrosine-type recombinase/integrase [Paraferrimonas haliotis]|uniref:tyrosine-type recombinase/integrase n=1 Tax=Paraferrimonas haliotis TaxID=2013866 RepID=UPI000BA96EC1|nr:tyrosine-type recombinase/integrase [Paraferrimonas haliotis]
MIKRHIASYSDAELRRLQKAGAREVVDRRYPRLVFRFTRTGGSWFQVVNSVWRKVGRWPETSAKNAIAHWAYVSSSNMNVGQVLTWALERNQQDISLSDKTRANKRYTITSLIGRLGHLEVKRITKADIDGLLFMPMMSSGYALSTIERAFKDLKASFARAYRLNIITINPLSDMMFRDFSASSVKPAGTQLLPHHLSDWLQVHSTAPPATFAMLALMVMFGTRIGETRKAKWAHFDLDKGLWRLQAEDVKTSQALTLPLSDLAIDVLNWYRHNWVGNLSVYLFPNADGKGCICADVASRRVREISQGDWSSHHIRKMMRSSLADLGEDYFTSERILNHAKSKLDQAYIHPNQLKLMRETLERWHQHLIDSGFKTSPSAR